jgi:hypothetical protein
VLSIYTYFILHTKTNTHKSYTTHLYLWTIDVDLGWNGMEWNGMEWNGMEARTQNEEKQP